MERPHGATRGRIAHRAILMALSLALVASLIVSAIGVDPVRAQGLPSAPTLVSPFDTIVVGASVTFEWTPVGGATGYILIVNTASNPLHATAKFGANVGNLTQYTDTGYPDDGTTYYWWVWAVNAAGQSPWPDVQANGHSFVNGAAPTPGVLRMNMKSYGNHNTQYDERILSIRPQYVIDNPPHGLYGEMDEQNYHEGYTYSYLLQDVAGYQAAGIKVIGYITSGYEGAGGDDHYSPYWYSLETNKMLITNMATLDHVDGVFIDEVTDYPNAAQKSYLQQLSDLAHSYGLIVWMNTGVDDFDEWYFTSNVADFMQSSEAWTGQSLSPVQAKWGSRISVTGFRRRYTAQDAYNLTIDAWYKGIAYCYINNVEYTKISPWFEEYAEMLRNWDGSYP